MFKNSVENARQRGRKARVRAAEEIKQFCQGASRSCVCFARVPPSDVRYTFDGERDKIEATICRPMHAKSGADISSEGQSCIKLKLSTTKMFEAMQDLSYFCQLNQDPTRTEISCTKV